MKKLSFLILSTVMLLAAFPAAAQGFIVPIQPGVATNPDWLTIDTHRVNVTIENQIATTDVSMQFTNNGEMLAEGTFIFPLPEGAAVDRLIMYIDGQAIESKILPAEEARGIYDEIVRQYRDPALLEYIGSDMLQANVFPIPPGEFRKIDISYGQLLEEDNGLIHYVYPLNAAGQSRSIEQMSISVNVAGDEVISNVYSPSHRVAISRPDDTSFATGFEQNNFIADGDFSLYYGVQRELIDINLLTYKESADEDGFFMLMVQPPLFVDEADIQPKDVVIVLDRSGSMIGEKWEQGRAAATYVLDNLNPQDRFNVVVFSTGWQNFANDLVDADNADDAINWLNGLFAEGGTDIYGGLSTAISFAQERPMSIMFMTDGLATEGIIETDSILAELGATAPENVRIFTFGVGDDVDTFLLDALVRDFRGTGSYVRPTERIDEEVASLYNKISAPVMQDISLMIDGVVAELMYPQRLPDLFAGEQLTIVGRYRGNADNATIQLSGMQNNEALDVVYNEYNFRDFAGGDPFIARLWATRRIGDLLNNIRLNGESDELVNSVVNLSIRYGIITPYTSFLIEEDDILSQQGRERAQEEFATEAEALAGLASGSAAVDAADTSLNMSNADAPAPMSTMSAPPAPVAAEPMDMDDEMSDMEEQDMSEAGEGRSDDNRRNVNPVQTVGGKTFLLQGDIWTDSSFEPDTMETTKITFLSDAYFDLLTDFPAAGEYFALGEQVIVVMDGTAYEIVSEAME
ncbi:MAG: VIT domain-containing protein [Aggregatilineales bacterium]